MQHNPVVLLVPVAATMLYHPLPQALLTPFLSLQCITSHTRHLKINSSLQMPDRVLNFIKDHFLMDSPVRSQPLLLQSQWRYQRLGVHRAQGLHGTYDVLFLGTGGCRWALEGQGVCHRPQPCSTWHLCLQMTGGCTRLCG